MRTVPAAITAARQASSSRLCKIWCIERADGTVLRFTEHDRDLTVDGETFLATASFDPSTIKAAGDLAVNDLDVQGAFDSALITAEDMLAGRYHGASFYVAETLWDNPIAKDVLRFGRIGRVKEIGGKFLAELLSSDVHLAQPVGRLYSATCRAVLGDAMCGVDMGPHTFSGAVVTGGSRLTFTASVVSVPEGDPTYFVHGIVTFTSGANDGLSMEVRSFDGTTCALLLSLPFDIADGDTFTITAGCDHSRTTCRDRFNNIRNFQGEPDVPVSDDLIRGPVRGVDQGAAETPPYDGSADSGGRD